jgi:hypothetical protein
MRKVCDPCGVPGPSAHNKRIEAETRSAVVAVLAGTVTEMTPVEVIDDNSIVPLSIAGSMWLLYWLFFFQALTCISVYEPKCLQCYWTFLDYEIGPILSTPA